MLFRTLLLLPPLLATSFARAPKSPEVNSNLPDAPRHFLGAKPAPSEAEKKPAAPAYPSTPAVPDAPLYWSGSEQTDTSADGGLRLAVGVHNIEVLRANRSVSPHADGLLHTYLHAPMLAHWKGRFYLEYLSADRNEHDAPTLTSFMTSADGLNWSAPKTAFPQVTFPDGSQGIAHQRMGFFVSPSGKLLILSFYGKHPSPNDGSGMGRAVREIHEDGSLGPVHFLRLNIHAGWTEDKVPFPLYSKSSDKGFIEACDALIANHLVRNQMWEEDQSKDGFYSIMGKAMSFMHRPDGKVVGIWKNALVALSSDEGKTWTTKVFAPGLQQNASKYWLQRTSDGACALVYNPTTRLRNPLVVATSQDGVAFSKLLTVHGELPDQRFGGGFKNLGPQYVRGITEGNGTPPGSDLWLTYSVNKEDLWISRVPVPITDRVSEPVSDNFELAQLNQPPAHWNIYSPAWAPVRVVNSNSDQGQVLELRDQDPYDYARAIRLFPETHGLKLSFKVMARQPKSRLEIDLQTGSGARPVRLEFNEDGHLWANHEGQWQDLGAYKVGAWHRFELAIKPDPKADRADLTIDGQKPLKRELVFAEPAATVERLSFRTGPHRPRGEGGRDLPGADTKAPISSFLIDDVLISPEK